MQLVMHSPADKFLKVLYHMIFMKFGSLVQCLYVARFQSENFSLHASGRYEDGIEAGKM